MENKEIKEFSKPRIDSVDRIRGLVMVYMIFMHALGKWTNGEHNWIYGVIWLFADGFGANVFVTISGIGLSLFYISKKNKIESDQNYTKYHARTSYMIKTAWLFLFNILTNLFLGYGFWFWMIMQTLSLGRIFAYPFLQTSPKFKI
ncbi:MAG: DUF1624 domain-containing protein, partial [archaeon]|nr:DUF1624 domain-containing protein [archaeon]